MISEYSVYDPGVIAYKSTPWHNQTFDMRCYVCMSASAADQNCGRFALFLEKWNIILVKTLERYFVYFW